MTTKIQLNFHKKIKFVLGEASEMLNLIYERELEGLSNKVSNLKDSSIFGPNKVTALLSWLKGFEFIKLDKNRGYILTANGKYIFEQDPQFKSDITHFIMHYFMSKNSILWNFFITEFLPYNSVFSREDLTYEIQEFFNLNKISDASKHILPILNFYLADNFMIKAFDKDLLSINANNSFISNNINPPNIYVFLFCLNDWWQNNFKDSMSVLRNDLIDSNDDAYGKIIGINQADLGNWLAKLHQMQFINEHLSVAPYTIDKKWNIKSLDILEKAYE